MAFREECNVLRCFAAIKTQKPSVSTKVIDDIDVKGARFLSGTPLEQICGAV